MKSDDEIEEMVRADAKGVMDFCASRGMHPIRAVTTLLSTVAAIAARLDGEDRRVAIHMIKEASSDALWAKLEDARREAEQSSKARLGRL